MKKQPGFTRGPRIADLMTVEYPSFLESSMAAERCGDAATALEYHRGIPMFKRSQHVGILTQLASLDDEMTPWLWARWAAYQCTRAEDWRVTDPVLARLITNNRRDLPQPIEESTSSTPTGSRRSPRPRE